MKAVEAGIDACLSGEAQHWSQHLFQKRRSRLLDTMYPGILNFYAEKTSSDQVLMMLVSGAFRVALATIHIPCSRYCPEYSD